jgi:hypothetical protein
MTSNPACQTTPAEREVLIHHLRNMAETHERLAEKDDYADTADTLTISMERGPALCGPLLRDVIQALKADGMPQPDPVQMRDALREIMNAPSAGPWAQMRAKCGLAVDL